MYTAAVESAEAMQTTMPWWHEGFQLSEMRTWTTLCQTFWDQGSHYEFSLLSKRSGDLGWLLSQFGREMGDEARYPGNWWPDGERSQHRGKTCREAWVFPVPERASAPKSSERSARVLRPSWKQKRTGAKARTSQLLSGRVSVALDDGSVEAMTWLISTLHI